MNEYKLAVFLPPLPLSLLDPQGGKLITPFRGFFAYCWHLLRIVVDGHPGVFVMNERPSTQRDRQKLMFPLIRECVSPPPPGPQQRGVV